MRYLKFNVNRQIIEQDPSCDFSDLVPGSEGYLKAEFSFSPEWNKTVKVAEFRRNGVECPPQVLEDGKTCTIPAEALKGRTFSIRVIGKKSDTKITTNKVKVCQDGGKT